MQGTGQHRYNCTAMRRVLIAAVAIMAFALGLGGGYLWHHQAKPAPQLQRATVLPDGPRQLPPFQLQDQDGRPFSHAQLKGHWTLLFFGYTHCPDICPLTLAEAKGFSDRTASTPYGGDTRVVFVSVDPKRDTPDRLKRYVKYFHPAFVGVTGAREQLDLLTRAVGIFYAYRGEGDDYSVDHSSAIVLLDANGDLRALFSAPHTADVLAGDYLAIREAAL